MFDRHVKPHLKQVIGGAECHAPCVLASCIFTRSGSFQQQRAVLAAMRSQSLRFCHDNRNYTVPGTTQKTRYQRGRNRRLMKLAAHVQACAFEGDKVEANKVCACAAVG